MTPADILVLLVLGALALAALGWALLFMATGFISFIEWITRYER